MIGDLKHRIVLQRSVQTPDGGGGFTEAWQNLADDPEVYAAIIPVSGGEQLRFYQLEARITHRIVIRFRSDVTTSMRAIKGNAIYDIVSVVDRDGQKNYLEILAVLRG